ncbi:MAG: S24 family peptidase [Bacteroidetes bacterium]|nr:MAG: S24 family peptidase [Bacteroidota bacterium]
MIKEDRLELNERFVKVFELLEKRGEIVKNDRSGKGMGDFAEKILGNRSYGHIIRAYLNPNDKRVISYSQARTLCREYGVSEAYMLDGVGTPFGFDLPNAGAPSNDQPAGSGNILFTTTEAFAGTTVESGSFAKEDHAWFSIPGISGNGLVAFPINGDSMEPVIMDGDLVICRQIENFEDIKDNEIYAVKNNGSLWVKYVQKIRHGGRITHLKLISANHLEYDPFIEEVNVHTRLYKVIRRVSDL